ncbi:MAG TPA: response regulator [Vicinamibacterales bacterium]
MALKSSDPRLLVLVVDDELLIRWALREVLEAKGYLVAEAVDATAARSAFVDGHPRPDAVVLDYHLPDSNDLQLLASIRHDAPSVPVIMMTAYSTAEMIEQALALGARHVVNKPFEVHQMADLVTEALPIH